MLCDQYDTPEFAYDGDGMGVGIRDDARKINEGRKLRRMRTIRATHVPRQRVPGGPGGHRAWYGSHE